MNTPPDATTRALATPEEVRAYLQLPSIATLHQWRHRGIGPKAARVGRHLRWRWDEVESWVRTQERDGPAAAASDRNDPRTAA